MGERDKFREVFFQGLGLLFVQLPFKLLCRFPVLRALIHGLDLFDHPQRPDIGVCIVHAQAGEQKLPPLDLSVERLQEPFQHVGRRSSFALACSVCYSSHTMGQVPQAVREASSFHVHQHQVQIHR